LVATHHIQFRYLQGEGRETIEHKLKILKRELKYIFGKLVYINNFVFADPQKKEAYTHCTHLQIAQAYPHPKFAKECNLALAEKKTRRLTIEIEG
jgi:hypothetical protein